MIKEKPEYENVYKRACLLYTSNAGFDVGFIEQNCRYQEIEPDFVSVDTVALARVLLPTLSKSVSYTHLEGVT